MCGNLYEWCEDEWHENYINAPTDGSAWSDGSNCYATLRGGSWILYPHYCRSAYRFNISRDIHSNNIGFRVVCVVGRIL
jgi:formylglycine-generating enzyme required for sulfatase activity